MSTVRCLVRQFASFSFVFVLGAGTVLADSVRDADMAAHLLGYLAVDYPATVSDGKVVDPTEYSEQREFVGRLVTLVERLPENAAKAELLAHSRQLVARIERKDSGIDVRRHAESLRHALAGAYRLQTAPRTAPNLKQAVALFETNCSGCHGESGRGDGPAARGLDPQPANFHDRTRQRQLSVHGLFGTITHGVSGSPMPAYAETLSESERWALAFYVADLAATPEERREGAALYASEQARAPFGAMGAITSMSPQQVAERYGKDALAVFTYLRSDPSRLSLAETPLARALRKLGESAKEYRANRRDEAYTLAVAAYLEGFELVERGLDALDSSLRQKIETELLGYRQLIQSNAEADVVDAAKDTIVAELAEARALLETRELSPAMAYGSSLVILLREGLEAILLIAVVVAFVVKTGQRAALRYIHIGWTSALLLGLVTWVLAAHVVNISGANRELTEGFTALVAAAVLLYLGFWLHNEVHTHRWKTFIEARLKDSKSARGLWGIALVAFIAVYREVLETVLFYQALWVQAGSDGHHAIVFGLVSAVVALAVLAWLIFRFSVRLPLRRFFQVNAVLLYVLAVVFAGQGVAAFQEAGLLPVTPVAFPRIDVLGVYPNVQSLSTQVALIALALSVAYGRVWLRAASAKPQ